MEKRKQNQEPEQRTYYLRGMGVLCLAALLFAAGLWRFGTGSIPASSRAGERELPIYCVDTPKKQVALSFDAAWGNEDTQAILDILEKNQVKATFFMTGGWVDSYPEDVKRIYAAGHDLGNHSQNHKNMSQLSDQEKTEEIMGVHEKVKALTGVEMELLRPPYGDYDNAVVLNARENGYYPIQWSVDSLDWKDYGVESIIQTVCENEALDGGAIILMHNGAKYTAKALETVIITLREKGYELVPISQLIYKENYHMDHTGKQILDERETNGNSSAKLNCYNKWDSGT